MVRLMDKGLEQLTAIVVKSGEVAKEALEIAVCNFMEGKPVKSDVSRLSEIVCTMTTEVENKAFELIVKYQPVASDLRIINSYIKIAYDFERYGRYAWDIVFAQEKLAELNACINSTDLMQKLVEKVCLMVSISIESLKEHDGEKAKTLGNIEEEVDKLYFSYVDKLAEMTERNRTIMCNLLVVRYLERIADHATYVGESIVYISTGEKISLR